MARLITKFKYLKPDERNHFGGYAEYIATREGVEKIDESKRNAPATNKQKQLIKKILSDFPDSKSSLEYEGYLKEETDLKKVSDELNAHTGNVWTAIVSLRREDAERLGYDNDSRRQL